MRKRLELGIRPKLTIAFLIVLTPLFIAEVLAVVSFHRGLRESAEVELTNTVNHLYRLVEVQSQTSENSAEGIPVTRPSPGDIATLRSIMQTFKVGLTGYPYIIDSQGTLIIHPVKEGQNIADSLDSKGVTFIRQMIDIALALKPGEEGTILYPWINVEQNETKPRNKILMFRYFKEWDWIIAAGSYEDEIYKIMGRVEWYMTTLMILSAFLMIVLSYGMSRVIVRPVTKLTEAATRLASGDLTRRVEFKRSGDELAELARSFNVMADQIREKTFNLERLVHARTDELRESREMYRSLVESTNDGIATTNLHGTITFVNSGMETMLGYSKAELLGRKIYQFYPGGIEGAKRIMSVLREQVNVTSHTMELIAKDGRVVPIRTSATLLYDPDGEPCGTLGIFSDVTAEKKLENELKQTQANLVQSMKLRALGDLVSGVAHEVNNPLMAATTMLHVVQSNPCTPDCRNTRRLDLIRQCHDRIARIVNHLREFSRQAPMALSPLDPHVPLENALLIIGQQLLNLNIRVERELCPDPPHIMGDANHLEQVFLDLIANARDAMNEPGRDRVLSVRSYRDTLNGKPAFCVALCDTGPGVPPGIRDKIFEPFFTTKELGKGTGLGLPICFGIVEAHGGHIELVSEPEKGACFIVTIPVAA